MAFAVEQGYERMKGAHERGRLAHAFLISGPVGCGKRRLAAMVIGMLQGRDGGSDLFGEEVAPEVKPLEELEGDRVRILRPQSKSRRIRVDEVRKLERSLFMASGADEWKVGVIVGAERMNAQAVNAFLKTLEEPPPQTLLMLLTTQPDSLLPTVISRCVRMPLVGEPDLQTDGGAELVAALDQLAAGGFGSAAMALSLKSMFSGMLQERRARMTAEAEEAIREEKKELGKVVEGDWFKRREEELKAATESEYLAARSHLFEVLQAWMLDVLRCKTGAEGLDFPASEASLRQLADGEPLAGLLRRMDALEELRATLETNAQEQLALEVGFLRAFG